MTPSKPDGEPRKPGPPNMGPRKNINVKLGPEDLGKLDEICRKHNNGNRLRNLTETFRRLIREEFNRIKEKLSEKS
jgi:hypothetical protein